MVQQIIDAKKIHAVLANSKVASKNEVRDILTKAQELQGLDLHEVGRLLTVQEDALLQEVFTVANRVKASIYGKRVVLFVPLYISNFCANECLYCAFRVSNQSLKRRALSFPEIARETELLITQGHKRILLVTGEAYPQNDFQYVLDAIRTVYSVKNQHGEIRRINVNLAPLDLDDCKRLKDAGIGTYQLFQETYHYDTYRQVHRAGKKTDYNWRLTTFDRALKAGIDDVGIGVLFGLYDWRFEVLALLQHANYLQERFGVGPHTISVPRLEPALGSELASNPLHPVSELDFCKIIAILRLAVPYTGIIMSTRETPAVRRQALTLGISQISAGSRTDPGGYGDASVTDAGQFSLGDHRCLDEVVHDLATLGYIPSFCTACYRLGRTGEDFMCLAKPGKIKSLCAPNALVTFAEYLADYATSATKAVGAKLIQAELAMMSMQQRQLTEKLLTQLDAGKRDIFI